MLNRKNLSALCCLFLLALPVCAQYSIHFIVTDSAKKDQINLAGNFNNWDPGNPAYQLTPLDPLHRTIAVKNLKQGHYEFKFARGNWATVESTSFGLDIDNRVLELKQDTTLRLTVDGWLDDYKDISTLPDTIKINIFSSRSYYYQERNLDSSYKYANEALTVIRKAGYSGTGWEWYMKWVLGSILEKQGYTDRALEVFMQMLPSNPEYNDSTYTSVILTSLGKLFDDEKDFVKAKNYYLDAIRAGNSITDTTGTRPQQRYYAMMGLARIYFNEGNIDSSIYYTNKADNYASPYSLGSLGDLYLLKGDIDKRKGNSDLALIHYRQAASAGNTYNNMSYICDAYQRIAQNFAEHNQKDSGVYYAKNAFLIAKNLKNPFKISTAGNLLVSLLKEENRLDSAFVYQQFVIQANDSLFNQEKDRRMHSLAFKEEMHKQDIKNKQQQYQNNIRTYGLLFILFIILLIVFFLWRNNRHKQKAYLLLQKQKQEIDKQKEKVEQTLDELQTTQKQLIQSEKMASLGELTAGIAHEIQNPLNFINNFSEVSVELLDELKEDLAAGKTEQVNAVAADIQQNLEKVVHHGKRADAIVKGMLHHARSSNGQKEPTDINELTDEYLRLSYHGLRARDKAFNATMHTDFDPAAGSINVITQDLGRVLLNLFNNAFYAIAEKEKQVSAAKPPDTPGTQAAYEPEIRVSTKRKDNKIEIKVRDNGNGIPKQVLDKIFQPFFTTKPTGQGTGLGLSISYDIITKGHGGDLTVETSGSAPNGQAGAENSFTEFTITLPAS